MEKRYIEIMDTTLRDGEQMMGVSYNTKEKEIIARLLLEEVCVDRVEITSARVSEGERLSALNIVEWARSSGYIDSIEVLGFVDYKRSVDWIKSVGSRVLNLLMKGSLNHLTRQLKRSPEEHIRDIEKTILYAKDNDVDVNVYLEDWSGGMRSSRDYVYYVLDSLSDIGVKRFMLPDTLGILYPLEVKGMLSGLIERYSGLSFDFHAHNDYGLGTANSLSAIEAGISGLHLTVNGMGERAGNASLDEVVASINDFSLLSTGVCTRVNEAALSRVSQEVEIFSGQRLAINKPIIGANVYTQTAGLHADGDLKGNLYSNLLEPERFGRKRSYALGKLSGMASLENNLNDLDIELGEEEKKRVLERIIELGDKKEIITEEDLPYIIGDVLDVEVDRVFKIKSCVVVTSTNLKPMATVFVEYKGEEVQELASGDGGYDAFMKAIRKIGDYFGFTIPRLKNYYVIIPPGGRTDALVQTTITWENTRTFKTKGVDSDQLLASVEATEKMINMILPSGD